MKNKIKTIRKIRQKGLSDKIFKFLEEDFMEILDLTADFLINPTGGRYRYSLGGLLNSKNYLNRSPYFQEEENGKYSITPKGRIKIIKNILKDKLNKEAEWKGFWWAIAFDMPEKTRNARNLLRRELKAMHFKEAQKSIWVTPYDIEKELNALLKLWLKDFTGNIKIFKIEKIIDDTELKEYFGIE